MQETLEYFLEDCCIPYSEIAALNFSDSASRAVFSAYLSSPEFNRVWFDSDFVPPLPTRTLDWDDFDDFYAKSDDIEVLALKKWLLG